MVIFRVPWILFRGSNSGCVYLLLSSDLFVPQGYEFEMISFAISNSDSVSTDLRSLLKLFCLISPINLQEFLDRSYAALNVYKNSKVFGFCVGNFKLLLTICAIFVPISQFET